LENKDQVNIPLLVIIASMGILFLILFIILIVLLYQKRMLSHKTQLINSEKDHQKQLLRASLEIAEIERRKIAANLHDDIGITLNVIKINFERMLINIQKQKSETVTDIISQSKTMLERSMDTVRAIHTNIIPPTLMNLGLVKAIKEICGQINQSGAVKISLTSNSEQLDLDKGTEVELHRLIKEVLNNTIRHGKPSFIEINIQLTENNLIVFILHNGMAITTKEIKEFTAKSTGIGLKSILTRAALLNGTIDYLKRDDGRSEVIIKCVI
jgi:two-component system NarL family sensor kinase